MLSDRSVTMLQKLLDFHALRHKVIANNIANAEVRNFRPSDVQFTRELAEAVAEGDVEALQKAAPKVVPTTTDLAQVSSGVDVEREMGALMKNKAFFDTFTEALNFKFRMLRNALGR